VNEAGQHQDEEDGQVPPFFGSFLKILFSDFWESEIHEEENVVRSSRGGCQISRFFSFSQQQHTEKETKRNSPSSSSSF